eukprot:TRINITY_DN12310_c0_g1_i1.p1 TRINITY_DN12310_c0_g1~~TRINITY_DN12310_c0_g1_i1.p1  ORF type:complete len:978 (+),score=442.03 TRINITY_DN12310_c0_g1_i1:70-3003(+)
MGKTRMTAVDLRASVSELSNRLVGQRLLNIYDINPKTYLLKFSGQDENQKDFVVIEVGSRIHQTTFAFDKPQVPSGFTLKIRKHIRQWRLDSLRQLGCDRVVEFTFGQGENAHRLLVEFYSKGNLILSDSKYSILALVRTHVTEDAKYAVRSTYPTTDVQLFRPMTLERMEEAFVMVEESGNTMSLKTAFSNTTEYGPAYVEHCLLVAGLRPNFKKAGAADLGRAAADALLVEFQKADTFLSDVPASQGYLVRRLDAKAAEEKQADKATHLAPAEAFEDFAPMLFKQHAADGLEAQHFDTFNAACDYYFSAHDQAAVVTHNAKSKKAAVSKVDKAMANHKKRIDTLQKEQESNLIKAQLIEDNAEEVEQALMIIRSAVGQAMDWTELWRIVKEQKKLDNPVAHMIHELKLDKNKVSLLLSADGEDEAECQVVDLDIALSAHANARTYFGVKKKIHEKEVKTAAAEDRALKSAQRKADKQADKKTYAPKKDIHTVRKILWFEKFNWFISSENFLVLSGRDAQQNEILVRRYLKKGDIYVHADMHGAATTIIKNPTGKGVPPDTLYQAGNMAVCRSGAWTGNIVISAWWVYHNQVSKTAPSGEYMPTGAFMIRGKKNFLPPTKLQMGAGILFRVHEENAKGHVGERAVADFDEEDDAVDMNDVVSEMGAVPGARSVAGKSVAQSICAASEAPSSIHCNRSLMDRYGLRTNVYTDSGAVAQAPVIDGEEDLSKGPARPQQQPKILMSAKERRQLKQKKMEAEAEVEAEAEAEEEEPAATGEQAKEKNRELTRAEKRKQKKIKKKYGGKEQDDDDRELNMRLCGWNGGLKGLDKEETEAPVEEKKVTIQEFREDDAFKKDRFRKDEQKNKQEETQVQMELDILDHLTGKPFEDDLILHPMLMVGPLEAVENFKYNISVLPGKEKKGKAAQQLLHHFSQSIVQTEQERSHIRTLDMQDCINLLPSNLRIVTAADIAKMQKKR